MPRRLLTLAATLSLTLFLLLIALSLHSAFHYTYLYHATPAGPAGYTHWELGSARGRLYLKRAHPVLLAGPPSGAATGPGAGPAADWTWSPSFRSPLNFSLAGLSLYHSPPTPTTKSYLELVLPLYLPLLLTLLLPARWYATRHRRTPGLCPTCGYDLRATPTRCPECGTPATTRSHTPNREPV